MGQEAWNKMGKEAIKKCKQEVIRDSKYFDVSINCCEQIGPNLF